MFHVQWLVRCTVMGSVMVRDEHRQGRSLESLVARLHVLELGSTDVAATAAFYERAMGYALSKEGDSVVARGPDRHLVFSPGRSKTLISVGFALADAAELERLRARLRAAGWESKDVTTASFHDAVEVQDPDGNRIVLGLAKADSAVSSQMPPARLQHVVVASRAPEKIVAFFIDVLGFTLSDDVLDEHGAVRTSFLRCSEEHHSFAVFLAAEDRLDHHCYETADWNAIRDWADHMAEQHIRIEWGPGRHGPGNNLFIFVHDPDGNWIEISAELEVVSHDRPVGRWPHEQRTLNSWGQGLLRS